MPPMAQPQKEIPHVHLTQLNGLDSVRRTSRMGALSSKVLEDTTNRLRNMVGRRDR